MLIILFGILIVLHGVVHFLYFGQSARLFELRPGMVWPDGSWAFSKLLGDNFTRKLASILLLLAALGFAAGGGGLLSERAWALPLIGWASVFSMVIFITFWDSIAEKLNDNGGISILINLVILAVVILLR